MSDDCDTSTENGHNFCMIPYEGTYNTNEFVKVPKGIAGCSGTIDSITGIDKPSCYVLVNDNYGKITRLRGENDILKPGMNRAVIEINYGPYIPLVGYAYTKRENIDIENTSILLPMDEDIKDPVKNTVIPTLIMGIEVIADDTFVNRLTGLYYTEISKLSTVSQWKGYNEGTGKIDLFEYNRKDIEGIGYSESNGSKLLLNGSYQDSALCGIWYKTNSSSITNFFRTNTPAFALCLAYRRFFDKNVNTEYVYLNKGVTSKSSVPPGSEWYGNECEKGEFISQLSFYYTDFNKKAYEQKLRLDTLDLITVFASVFGIGLKGIGMYRSLNYNSKNGLYKWVNEVDSLTCCQMLSNKQYNDDTVEKYVCRENLNYKVNNNFPNSYPNDQCKVLLGNWCSSSSIVNGEEVYNIEDDLCEKACDVSDINCDKGIKDYCLRPENQVEKDPQKNYDLGKITKNRICGCLTSQNYKNNDVLTSLPLSFKTVLEQKLLNKGGIDLDKQECILPYCSQTPFKLLSMKSNLEKNPCNKKESCFGNGYAIGSFVDGNKSIDCEKYKNVEECIDPLTPKVTVIPDPFNDACKNLIVNEPEMPKNKPAECKYGEKWYPEDPYTAKCEMHIDPEDGVEKLMLRSYRQLEKPSVPDVPPGQYNPLCPPKCGENNYNCDYPLKSEDEREPVEKWEPCYNEGDGTEDNTPPNADITKIGFTILIFAIFFALLFSIVIKIF